MPCKNEDLSSALSPYIRLGMVMCTCNLSAEGQKHQSGLTVSSRQQDYLKRRKTVFPRMTPEAVLCPPPHAQRCPCTHINTHIKGKEGELGSVPTLSFCYSRNASKIKMRSGGGRDLGFLSAQDVPPTIPAAC